MWLVAGILIASMILFIKELLAAEFVALLALMALVVTRVLTPDEAFRSFGDPALITIASVFVLSAGLTRTGFTQVIAHRIERISGANSNFLLLMLMVAVTLISAFMNNVAATAVLLPVAIGTSQRLRIHPGKLAMPIAFASMFGGTCTAIGTSTNMVLSSYLVRNGMPAFGLFEFAPVGLLIAATGIAYMMIVGRRMLPERGEASLEGNYHLREYTAEVVILPDSPLVGKTILKSDLSEKLDLNVVGLIRGKRKSLVLRGEDVLQAGDLLLVEGRVDNILKIKDTYGIEIKPDFKLTDRDLQDHEIKLAEAVVPPRSTLLNRTLKDARFRQRYELVALGLHRRGLTVRYKISQLPLELGDVLLLQGREDRIHALRSGSDLLLLEDLPVSAQNRRRGWIAVLIFLCVIGVSASGFFPIVLCTLAGGVLMVLTRCIKPEAAYQSINWPTILLIAGMSSLGVAMEKTGLARHTAEYFLSAVGAAGPHIVLACLFLLTVVLTQPMSNAAAALLVAPIAISTAHSLSLNPRAFIMTVALAASCSFMTPLEPASALVYGPGRYRFMDFVKCGLPLTLLLLLLIVCFVPVLWPL